VDDSPFAAEGPPINWTATPPPPERLKIEVWNPRPGNPVVACVLSERIVGVYSHFLPDQKATVPCLAPGAFCEHCVLAGPRRWQGWLAGLSYSTGRLYLVQVTTNAARSCPVLLQPKVTLRGGRLTLQRRGEANNSPVQASFLSGVPKKELPPAFDVVAQLLTLWGLRRPPRSDLPVSLPGGEAKKVF
jgi:hypothetical protein